jgi:hypothetical protein
MGGEMGAEMSSPSSSFRDHDMDWADNLEGVDAMLADGEEGLQPHEGLDEPQLDDLVAAAAARAQGDLEPAASAVVPQPPAVSCGEDGNESHAAALVSAPDPAHAPEGPTPAAPPAASQPPPAAEGVQAPYMLSEKAQQYLAMMRAGQVGKLRSRQGEKVLAYDAILAEKKRQLAVQNLVGCGGPIEVPDVGVCLAMETRGCLHLIWRSIWGSRRW